MSGKRLLDLVALFNASRGVAQKHITLRTRQAEVYNKTSSLARAVRNQTDRITETAKAASILASRLNESAPAWASEAEGDGAAKEPPKSGPIPNGESTEGHDVGSIPKGGLGQDHFYEKSIRNFATDKRPKGELYIRQETASQDPLPDGSNPPNVASKTPLVANQDISQGTSLGKSLKHPAENDGLRLLSSVKSSIPFPSSKTLSADAARTIQRRV